MKKPSFYLLVVLLVTLLTGCGGGPDVVEVTVTLNEFTFSPKVIEASPGAQLTINLNNQGALDHNFVLMAKGVRLTEWTEADQEHVLFEQIALRAGETTFFGLVAPDEPGEYQFLCSVPGHLTQGMEGTLIVTAP